MPKLAERYLKIVVLLCMCWFGTVENKKALKILILSAFDFIWISPGAQ
ncbi:hypothetical protein [Draconibacterium sediminis]|nr:hypothetical protein [Draconibacterium sediminis]